MKKTLLIVLLLSFGFSQQLTEIVETYDNGNIKSITYHKKSRNGIEKVKYEEYYENGQKSSEKTYKNGQEDGKWTNWYENGQKWLERTYKDGKLDGLYTEWYENGQKEKEGTYKDGKEDGLKTYWNEYGQVVEETVFDLGNLMNRKEYDYYPTGEVYTIETNDGIITYYSIKGEIEKETKNGKIWKDFTKSS